MGSSAIFKGTKTQLLTGEGINLKNGSDKEVVVGSVDPTVTSVNSGIGSLYLRDTTNEVFIHLSSGDNTNWKKIDTNGDLVNYFKDSFDGAVVGDFSTGNNATFLNGGVLAGTFEMDSASPIDGSQSFKYTQAVGSANDWIASGTVTINERQQLNRNAINFIYEYDGDDDDIELVFWDATNTEELPSSDSLKIKNTDRVTGLAARFYPPAGVTSVNWGIKTVVENSGAILSIDNLQISTTESQVVRVPQPFQNSFSARINNNGTATLEDESGSFIQSISRVAAGRVQVNFVPGFFTVLPSVTATCLNNAQNTAYSALSLTGVEIQTSNLGGGFSFADTDFSMQVERLGSDFRLTDLEKVINVEGIENHFSSIIANSGAPAVTTQNISFIDSVSLTATGRVQVNFIAGMFSEVPNIIATPLNNAQTIAYTSLTASGVEITSFNTSGGFTFVNTDFSLTVSRQGSDYKNIQDVVVEALTPKSAVAKDVKSSGTSGGTFTSGAWRTRELNVLETVSSNYTLDSDGLTLRDPGTYKVMASAPARRVGNHKARIQDITNGTTLAFGTPMSTDTGTAAPSTTTSLISTIFTITSPIVIELQHRCTDTRASDGFGQAQAGITGDEVYGQLTIEKVS